MRILLSRMSSAKCLAFLVLQQMSKRPSGGHLLPQTPYSYGEQHARHARGRDFRDDTCIKTHTCERAPNDARREVQEWCCATRKLGGADAGSATGTTKELEAVIGEHKHATVVSLKIVDLLAEDRRPEILANVFYSI